MNCLGRWTHAVVARIDHLVAQVENHESLAESALRDVQRSLARARVRLERVRRDGHRLEQQLRSARSASCQWRRRAKKDENERRALECLRRSKELAHRAGELERRLAEHRSAEKQLLSDVTRVQERLRELKEKRNLLRTRQSRAEAMSAARTADDCGRVHLDDVFERWEERITTIELDDEPDPGTQLDSFEMEYVESEEDDALRLELDALRREREAVDADSEGEDTTPPRDGEAGDAQRSGK